MTVLHASQCTPLASCSSAMDVEQDKGWIASIFEWLRRYYGKNIPRASYPIWVSEASLMRLTSLAQIGELARRLREKVLKILNYLNDRTCKLISLTIKIYYLSYLYRWFLGPQVTLQDCLSAFFSADELKGTSYSIMKR